MQEEEQATRKTIRAGKPVKKGAYAGLGRDPEDKLIISKSNPLTSLWKSELTLSEFKILDAYLARIDSHKPEKRLVKFSKEEFARLMNVTKINLPELEERLKHLISQPLKIIDPGESHGFSWVSLFEEACVELDDETRVNTIYLECTQKAMRYFFNIENLGYLRYKLRAVKNMKSRYTYILFLYLEKNRKMHLSWEVNVDELRDLLNCEDDPSYDEYKLFNNRILKHCKDEIEAKTECRYTYESIKVGRVVRRVRFNLEPIVGRPPIVEVFPPVLPTPQEDSAHELYASVLPEEFSPTEVDAIALLAAQNIEENPAEPFECTVAAYLARLVALMNASRKPVKYKYKYLKRMIENKDKPKIP